MREVRNDGPAVHRLTKLDVSVQYENTLPKKAKMVVKTTGWMQARSSGANGSWGRRQDALQLGNRKYLEGGSE